MSESFLGLRHGPLSWLDGDSLVVGFLSNSAEKRKAELGLLEELGNKAAAGGIVTTASQKMSSASHFSDWVLILGLSDLIDDKYRPPVDILFAQCLGLFASLRYGLKPDTPSSDGKIQRVVSKIRFA
jgi:tagatose-6-phosphate ketose/aldose isomerase